MVKPTQQRKSNNNGKRRRPTRRPVKTRRLPRNNNRSRRPRNWVPRAVLGGASGQNFIAGTERIKTVIVKPNAKPGDVLAKIFVSPLSAPRAAAISGQFDSWAGPIRLEVESAGNSLSKNYVICHHFNDASGTRIPTNPDELLSAVDCSSTRGETAQLQLDSNKKVMVVAPWRTSYNPTKPLSSTDSSESCNGVFYIVANGSPGDTEVSLTVRLTYSIRFYGASLQLIPTPPGTTAELQAKIKDLEKKLAAATLN